MIETTNQDLTRALSATSTVAKRGDSQTTVLPRRQVHAPGAGARRRPRPRSALRPRVWVAEWLARLHAAVDDWGSPVSPDTLICPGFGGVGFLESFGSKEDSDAPRVLEGDPSPGGGAGPFRHEGAV